MAGFYRLVRVWQRRRLGRQEVRTYTLEATQSLTQREEALVRAIARGLSNRQIAAEFRISEQRVKNRLSVIYQKLHVRNRLELAIYALRSKRLPHEDEK